MTASAAASSRTIAFADTGQPSWHPVSGAGRLSVTHRRASTAPRRIGQVIEHERGDRVVDGGQLAGDEAGARAGADIKSSYL